MIEEHLPRDRGRVILHWFTGSRSEAKRAVALGCYFSINAEMVRADRGRALVAELPFDRILTETDGPFTQVDGRPSEPADVKTTVTSIARVLGLSPESVGKRVQSNLRSLLG